MQDRLKRPGLALAAMAIMVWAAAAGAQPSAGGGALPGVAGAAGQPGLQGPLGVDLDFKELIAFDHLFPTGVDDAIWKVEAPKEHMLVAIPVLVTPRETAQVLTEGTLQMRDARFVAWKIEAPAATGPARATRDEGGPAGKKASTEPPRLARRVTINPDGTVHWTLDHSIVDATQKQGDLAYLYKLHSDLLEKRQPVHEVLKPGPDEKPAALAAQREAADKKYRQEMADFRDLRQTVRQLPTDLSATDIHRVWALFDLRPRASAKHDEIELTLNGAAPLPWGLSIGELSAVHAAAQPVGDRGHGLPNEWGEALVRLMAAHPHPWTCRLCALAIANAKVATLATAGHPLYEALKTILDSDDVTARRCITEQLGAATKVNKDLMSLLLLAAGHHDAVEQAEAIKGLLAVDPGDEALAGPAVAASARMVLDPAGAPADQLVEAMLEGARAPGMEDRLATAIQFEQLGAGDANGTSRRDQAVGVIVAQAGDNALAARWLQNSLLVSKDTGLLAVTLTKMAALAEKAPGSAMAAEMPGGPAQRGARRGPVAAKPTGPKLIAMQGTDNGLVAVLRSAAPDLQALAWRSLPLFTVASESPEGGARKAGEAASALDQLIVQLALAFHPTPAQVIEFLTRQSDAQRVGEGLVRMAIGGDDAVGLAAARALVGVDRPLDRLVPTLDIAGREALVERVYQAATSAPAPLAVGLIRDPRPGGKVSVFFGQCLARGKLPSAAEWAAAYGPEDKLLAAVGSGDERLGLGAAAGLVATAGGGDDQARELADAVRAGHNSPDATRNAWFEVRRGIVTAKLQHAAGPYKLRLLIYGKVDNKEPETGRRGAPHARVTLTALKPGGRIPAAPAPSAGEQTLVTVARECNCDLTYDLGVQTLAVQGVVPCFEGQPIAMSVPEGQYAIQIEHPKDLTVLPCDGWQDLALDKISKAIILRAAGLGGWEALFRLSDGRVAQLILESASG